MSALCTASAFAAEGFPTNTVAPSISGTAQIGSTLMANKGTWTGAEPLTYTYQWERCNASGSSCSAISGKTLSTYTVATEDAGHTLKVVVTAKNGVGENSATSAATSRVAELAPENKELPKITGEAKEEASLETTNGSWTSTGALTYTYQWQRCSSSGTECAGISGAIEHKYTIAAADVDHELRVVVTAKNEGGETSSTSATTAVITGKPTISSFSSTSIKTSEAKVAAFVDPNGVATEAYVQYGTTTSYGSETSALLAGGTGTTPIEISKLLTGLQPGTTYHWRVKAANARGSVFSGDQTFTTVAETKPENTGLPTISGTLREESVLTATAGTWTGTEPITYSYQWQRCSSTGTECANILIGGTTSSYTLTSNDAGHELRVVVNAHNNAGEVSANSAITALVGGKPTVTFPTTTNIEKTSATLGAFVDPNGTATEVYFQYGATTSYGSETTYTLAGAGASPVEISKTLSGLAQGTTYHWRVRAVSSFGTTYSGDQTFTTPQTTPINTVAPSVTVPLTEGAILVGGGNAEASTGTWTSGGNALTYTYQWQDCSEVGGVPSCLNISNATSATYTPVAADIGSKLRVVVTATDVYESTSAASALTSAVVSTPTITNETTTAVSYTGAVVHASFNANGSTGEEGHDHYYWEYGKTTSYGSTTTHAQLATGFNAQPESATLTGLEPGKTYHVRAVVTTNLAPGVIHGPDETVETKASPIGVLTGSATSASGVSETLQATIEPNGTPDAYTICYRAISLRSEAPACLAQSGEGSVTGVTGTSAEELVSATLTGLEPNQEYAYKVIAHCELSGCNQNVSGETKWFKTAIAPSEATTNEATEVSETTAKITGTITPNGVVSEPLLYIAKGASGNFTLEDAHVMSGASGSVSASPVPVSYVITGLEAGVTYHYAVAAQRPHCTPNCERVFGNVETLTTTASQELPTVSGEATIGQTLEAHHGTWNGLTGSITYTYQWQRCNESGGECVNITGATNETYTLAAADRDHQIRVVVTASCTGAVGEAVSSATQTVEYPHPAIVLKPATNVGLSSALFHAELSSRGGTNGRYCFYYATTPGANASNATGHVCGTFSGEDVEVEDWTGENGESLAPHTTYYYWLQAETSYGMTITTDLSLTTAEIPSNVTITPEKVVTPTTAKVHGSFSGCASCSYVFKYGTTTAYGGENVEYTYQSGSFNTKVEPPVAAFSGLTPGTVYHYRLCVDYVGQEQCSADATLTTDSAPTAATTTAATNVTSSQARLTGSALPNGFATSGFFEYGTTTAYGQSTPLESLGSSGTVTGVHVISGLGVATTYHYRFVAERSECDCGLAYGEDQTFTTEAGAVAVSTEAASGLTPHAATLNATIDPEGNNVSYYFEYSTSPDLHTTTRLEGGEALSGTTPQHVSAELSGLTEGKTLYYRVVATPEGGQTLAGATLSLTTPIPLPVNTSAPTISFNTSEYGNNAPALGELIDANQGSWSTATETTYAYQWEHCTSAGSECAPISGATSSSYRVTTADLGDQLRVSVTASDATGEVDALSAMTGATIELPILGTPSVTPAAINGTATTTVSGALASGGSFATVSGGVHNASAVNHVSQDVITTTLTSLEPGTTYHLHVTVYDANFQLTSEALFTTEAHYGVESVVTLPASTTENTAELNGLITAGGYTSWHWEYWEEPSGQEAPTVENTTPETADLNGEREVSVALSGLNRNTLYYARLVATEENGACPCKSGSYQPVITQPAPSATETLSALTPSATEAYVRGEVNAPAGLTQHYYFQYGSTTAYGNETHSIPIEPGQASPFATTISNLTPGASYHYRILDVVQLANATYTYYGADHIVTMPAAKPGISTPTPAPRANLATIEVPVATNGGTTSVHLIYGTTEAYGQESETTSVSSSGSPQFVLSGLTPETTYHYRVVATNSGGTTTSSDLVFTTYGIGGSVVQEEPTSITTTSIALHYTLTPNTTQEAGSTEYSIEYCKAGGVCASSGWQSDNARGQAALTLTLTSLEPATSYSWKVLYRNRLGSSSSSSLSFTTKAAPGAITGGVGAVLTAPNQLTVHGIVKSEGVPTTGCIEYGLTEALGQESGCQEVSSSSGSDVTAQVPVSAGQTVYYRVAAERPQENCLCHNVYGAVQSFQAQAPSATTEPASAITREGAQLNAAVDGHEAADAYYYEYATASEYATTHAYSARTETQELPTTGPTAAPQVVTGQPEETEIDYRVVVVGVFGTTPGADRSFVTVGPPQVKTSPPSSETQATAQFVSDVNGRDVATSCHYEYGLASDYEATRAFTATTPSQSVSASSAFVGVSAAVGSLAPETKYAEQPVCTNEAGTTRGEVATVETVGRPLVETQPALNITETSAQLTGSVNGRGLAPTYYYYEYGTAKQYAASHTLGSRTPVAALPKSNVALPALTEAAGLTPETEYAYRICAANPAGTRCGAVLTLETAVCTQAPVVLTDVHISGDHVELAGVADPSLNGQEVALESTWNGAIAATAVINKGVFQATAPLPEAGLRDSNEARYVATLWTNGHGEDRSAPLKLTRRAHGDRVIVSSVHVDGSGVATIRGRVVGPYTKPISPVVLTDYSPDLCRERVHTIARLKPGRHGHFSFNVRLARRGEPVVYRVQTGVAAAADGRYAGETYTLPLSLNVRGPAPVRPLHKPSTRKAKKLGQRGTANSQPRSPRTSTKQAQSTNRRRARTLAQSHRKSVAHSPKGSRKTDQIRP